MVNLPKEVWANVFDFPASSDLQTLQYVNRQFSKIVRTPALCPHYNHAKHIVILSERNAAGNREMQFTCPPENNEMLGLKPDIPLCRVKEILKPTRARAETTTLVFPQHYEYYPWFLEEVKPLSHTWQGKQLEICIPLLKNPQDVSTVVNFDFVLEELLGFVGPAPSSLAIQAPMETVDLARHMEKLRQYKGVKLIDCGVNVGDVVDFLHSAGEHEANLQLIEHGDAGVDLFALILLLEQKFNQSSTSRQFALKVLTKRAIALEIPSHEIKNSKTRECLIVTMRKVKDVPVTGGKIDECYELLIERSLKNDCETVLSQNEEPSVETLPKFTSKAQLKSCRVYQIRHLNIQKTFSELSWKRHLQNITGWRAYCRRMLRRRIWKQVQTALSVRWRNQLKTLQ